MNYIETYLARRLEIKSTKEMKISDPKCEILTTLMKNGAPIRIKSGVSAERLTYDDVDITGKLIRHRSDNLGVRYEWSW